MKRRDAGKAKRGELAWLLTGFVAVQLALGVAVDRFWTGVRDPEFAARSERLAERIGESGGRPLMLVLGSSRTGLGLRAGDLNRPSADNAPLVFNFAIPTSGPMYQQVVLRRLLAEGVRPAFAVIELMPMSISSRGGTPQEESQLDTARLNAAEVRRIARYYHSPRHIAAGYGAARLLPADRHQAELRDAIGLDRAVEASGAEATFFDAYGWRQARATPGREEFDANVRFALRQYSGALNDGTPAAGPLRAFTDLLAMCRESGISAALVMPPEGSMFRDRAVDYAALEAAIRDTACRSGARLYDARTWIDDVGFYDGHHLTTAGAVQYTERFGREVLEPELALRATRGGPLAALGIPGR